MVIAAMSPLTTGFSVKSAFYSASKTWLGPLAGLVTQSLSHSVTPSPSQDHQRRSLGRLRARGHQQHLRPAIEAPRATQSNLDASLQPVPYSLLNIATRLLGAPIGMVVPASEAQAFSAVCITQSPLLEPAALVQRLAPVQHSAALEVVLVTRGSYRCARCGSTSAFRSSPSESSGSSRYA